MSAHKEFPPTESADESITHSVVVGNLVTKTHRFTGNILPLFLTPVGCVIFTVVLVLIFNKYRNCRRQRNTRSLEGISEQNNPVVHAIELHEEQEQSHIYAATPYFQDSSTSSLIDSDEFQLEGTCIINIGAENSSTIEVEVEVHNPPNEVLPVQLSMGNEEFEDPTVPLCEEI